MFRKFLMIFAGLVFICCALLVPIGLGFLAEWTATAYWGHYPGQIAAFVVSMGTLLAFVSFGAAYVLEKYPNGL